MANERKQGTDNVIRSPQWQSLEVSDEVVKGIESVLSVDFGVSFNA